VRRLWKAGYDLNMSIIGKEQYKNRDFNLFFRMVFWVFGAPEIGAKIRSKWALSQIDHYHFKFLLDGGCGKGYLSFQIARRYPYSKVDGIDIDPQKIRSNTAIKNAYNLSNLHYRVGSLLNLHSNKKYDLILLSDVLEHIPDDDQVLKSLRKSIADNGNLIIHVPRSKQYFFFRKAANYIVEDHVRPGYTEKELLLKLKAAGFKAKRVIPSYTYFESLASQIGNIFSNNLFIYSILFPFLVLFSHIPQTILHKKKHISNTIIIIAEPNK
jgi:trans-aconitate methyltransferase